MTVTARYGNCRYYHEREVQLYLRRSTIGGEVLGVGRDTAAVALDQPAWWSTSPMIVDCPDRTLNRDDDVRGTPSSAAGPGCFFDDPAMTA